MSNPSSTLPPSAAAFQLKAGLHPLTVLQLFNTELKMLDQQLEEKVQQAPKFFENAPMVLDLTKLQSHNLDIDFAQIKELLIQHRLIPVGVKNGNAQQHANAVLAGFAILQENIKRSNPNAVSSAEVSMETHSIPTDLPVGSGHSSRTQTSALSTSKYAKLVTTEVRSGQQVYAKGCDLIVLGSISHGAELLSDGHIHVYGALRGRALAGINGNKQAHIFCHSLEAELVSIAGQYKLSEDIEKIAWRVSVDISLVSGQLNIRLI